MITIKLSYDYHCSQPLVPIFPITITALIPASLPLPRSHPRYKHKKGRGWRNELLSKAQNPWKAGNKTCVLSTFEIPPYHYAEDTHTHTHTHTHGNQPKQTNKAITIPSNTVRTHSLHATPPQETQQASPQHPESRQGRHRSHYPTHIQREDGGGGGGRGVLHIHEAANTEGNSIDLTIKTRLPTALDGNDSPRLKRLR